MYKTVIVGAGSIGALKPHIYDSPDTKEILTHAHACYSHPDIDLIGIIDKDFDKAYTAANKWYTNPYEDISHIKKDIDIIIVATPTNTHKDVLLECLNYNPKIMIAEKPFCLNSTEAKEVIEVYEEKRIPIIVDYIRAFDYNLSAIVDAISDGDFGQIYSVILYYVRGFSHEACHAIELFNRMLGNFITGKLFKTGNIFDDGPSISYTVHLKYEKCPNVIMIPIDSRKAYNVFNIEIMTDKGKVVFSEHGKYSEFYNTMPEPTYGNYKTLSVFPVTRIETNLTVDLIQVLYEAVNYIQGKTDGISRMSCIASDTLKVHEVMEEILKGE